MPLNNPISSTYALDAFLGLNSGLMPWEGIVHPQYLKGGFQHLPTLQDLYNLPIKGENTNTAQTHDGFTHSDDGGYTSGRRSVGS